MAARVAAPVDAPGALSRIRARACQRSAWALAARLCLSRRLPGPTLAAMTEADPSPTDGSAPQSAAHRPRHVLHRRGGPPPHVRFPRRHLRRRPGLRQYRGMVSGDPRGASARPRTSLLPSARRECGILLRRLCQPAESAAPTTTASRSTIPPSPACSTASTEGRYRLRPGTSPIGPGLRRQKAPLSVDSAAPAL